MLQDFYAILKIYIFNIFDICSPSVHNVYSKVLT